MRALAIPRVAREDTAKPACQAIAATLRPKAARDFRALNDNEIRDLRCCIHVRPHNPLYLKHLRGAGEGTRTLDIQLGKLTL